jgi:hypothetical protein
MDNASQVNLTPIKVAYIIDNKVVDVLHTDERLSSIFLSNPVVVDVTKQFDADSSSIRIGMDYDPATGQFTDVPPLPPLGA